MTHCEFHENRRMKKTRQHDYIKDQSDEIGPGVIQGRQVLITLITSRTTPGVKVRYYIEENNSIAMLLCCI